MKLRGVGRRYGLRGPWVLRGVDLELPRQPALLRVEGANGSGKSTLLRLLAGIDTPSAGRITGRPRAAYVPERFPAVLPFDTLDYLTHLGRVHGLRGPEAARRGRQWLVRFDAEQHARTPLAELSKGTSQKVAVAQALLADPELLLLDEAWTGLDETARGVLDRAVTERVADGGTVVFVDHDPRRLAGAADGRYGVAGGRLVPVAPGLGEDGGDPARADGPQVLVEAARGPIGGGGDSGGATVSAAQLADLSRALPGAPRCEPGPLGTVRLTVPAAGSDAVLRALLAAHPPWHIRAVHALATPAEGDGRGTDAVAVATGTAAVATSPAATDTGSGTAATATGTAA
ncbi:ABC transporter ATP-binding protein, partial [Streptomyces sp. H27-D2]|uniref:ABC transporter ATP-binding protein n=1 Tax=Streptomyces sp. H27-D2 TaxID=3046304 RepID=UPI002DBA3699